MANIIRRASAIVGPHSVSAMAVSDREWARLAGGEIVTMAPFEEMISGQTFWVFRPTTPDAWLAVTVVHGGAMTAMQAVERDPEHRWRQPGIAALSIRPVDASLSRLREATNTALQQAHGHVDGAINWGDLRCLEARHFVTDDGDTGYQVFIEEADPAANDLHRFISKKLAEAGFAEIEVVTAW